jgi:undecaprenyl-diphosphatase
LVGLTTAPSPHRSLDQVLRVPAVRVTVATVALILGLGVFVVRAWLARVGPLPGDHYIAVRLPNPKVPHAVAEFSDFFAAIAYPLVALVTVAVAAWVVHRVMDDRRAAGVVVAASAVIVNAVLKALFGPTQMYADAVGHSDTVNYPSGHVTYATAVFGYLGYLSLERRRPEGAIVALLLIAIMGPARLITGAHIPSDVLGGYLLGTAWLLGTILWTTRR